MTQKFKLIQADEPLTKEQLTFVLFGQPGIGKTSLSFTMPGPVVHFDFDNGIHRAIQSIRPDFYSVNDYGAFSDFVFSEDFQITVEQRGWKTVVLDTVGTLLDNYLSPWIIRQDAKNGTVFGTLSLSGWGALAATFEALKTRLTSLGLCVVMICHEKDSGDSKQIGLAVKGGSTNIIYQSCDMIGYMYVSGKKRMINFNPTSVHIGKNISGLDAMEVPDFSSSNYNTFLTRIDQKCKDRLHDLSLKQIAAQELIDSYKKDIQGCTKPEDFDRVIASLADEVNIIQKQVKVFLRRAMKALGMKYDRTEQRTVLVEPAEVTADADA